MANSYFRFKQFTIQQADSAMKVTTDACLFGAWTARELEKIKSKNRLLDIGTGTGLLSLMVSQAFSSVKIDAVELDAGSAAEARMNIEAAGKTATVSVYSTDFRLFNPGYQYDVILSNPPFYENELRSSDERKNKAHHDAGLRLEELITGIKNILLPEGSFFLLLPYKRLGDYLQLADSAGITTEITPVKPRPENPLFRVLIRGWFSSAPAIMENETICIKDETDQYTAVFSALLKPYYLYL